MPASETKDPEPRMRVLVFTLAYSPFVGGAEVAIGEIMERLPQYEFDIVTLRFDTKLPAFEIAGNVRIHRIGFGKPNPTPMELLGFPLYLNKVAYPFIAARKALSLMRKERYGAMWAIMSYMAFPAYFASLRRRVPYVVTLQDGDSIEHITRRLRIRPVLWLLKRAFRKAAALHAISTFLARFGRELGYAGEISVIPNGVDVAVFTKEYDPTETESFRRELSQKFRSADRNAPEEQAEDAYVVTASRLVAKNGVGDLIAAMQYLPAHAKLVILGDGPDMLALKSMTSQFGLDARVLFAGHVDQREIARYFSVCHVFARPSRSEGFGNAFIEAMAAGVPVVATPVGGIVDFVFDPEKNPGKEPTGVFCEPGNPRSIAEKIKLLLEDAELRERIVANARPMAVSHYDWNRIAEAFERLFDRFRR